MSVHQRGVLTALLLAALQSRDLLAQGGAELRGRVVDAGAHRAVSGAEVRLDDGRVAITGVDGAFRFDRMTSANVLVVRHVSYADVRVRLDRDDTTQIVVVVLTPKPVSLDAVVVTASRRNQRLADVPVATEVVAREEIRESGAADLSAVLTERTGVVLQGGHPVGSGVMLQGIGSERVLVLLDGQPYIGRISGQLDLSRIPTSIVDRVEIVKGPQSTMYGSEAMGGVVNVITRPPAIDAWSGGLGLVGGSRGRLDLSADLRGGSEELGFVADAGRRTIELVPGYAGEASTLATRWDAMGKVNWRPRPGLTVAASGVLLDERQRWRSGQLYSFADNVQWGGRLSSSFVSGRHRLVPTIHATEFRHLARSATGPAPVEGSGEEEQQRLIEAEVIYGAGLGPVDLDAGIEAKRESIHSDRVQDKSHTLHSIEPFLQGTLTRGQWSVVPGMRLSWSEQWGTHWTPRVAAIFRPTDRLALRASIGRGYRAPDFKELYMEFLNVGPGFGYVVRGNPDLQPETARNLSGSVEWAGDRVYLRVQGFVNNFRDFIETREVGDSSGVLVFTYGNVDDGTTRGIELEVGTTWRGLRAEGGWSWLTAERANGERLLGRPVRSGRASLTYAAPFGLRASVTGVYTGKTAVRQEADGLVERDPFGRLDLRLAQALPRSLEISLGVDNITNVRPEDWPGFLGRQIYLGMSWRAGPDGASVEVMDGFREE